MNELKVYYIEDVGNHVMFTKVEKDMVDAVHKVRIKFSIRTSQLFAGILVTNKNSMLKFVVSNLHNTAFNLNCLIMNYWITFPSKILPEVNPFMALVEKLSDS